MKFKYSIYKEIIECEVKRKSFSFEKYKPWLDKICNEVKSIEMLRVRDLLKFCTFSNKIKCTRPDCCCESVFDKRLPVYSDGLCVMCVISSLNSVYFAQTPDGSIYNKISFVVDEIGEFKRTSCIGDKMGIFGILGNIPKYDDGMFILNVKGDGVTVSSRFLHFPGYPTLYSNSLYYECVVKRKKWLADDVRDDNAADLISFYLTKGEKTNDEVDYHNKRYFEIFKTVWKIDKLNGDRWDVMLFVIVNILLMCLDTYGDYRECILEKMAMVFENVLNFQKVKILNPAWREGIGVYVEKKQVLLRRSFNYNRADFFNSIYNSRLIISHGISGQEKELKKMAHREFRNRNICRLLPLLKLPDIIPRFGKNVFDYLPMHGHTYFSKIFIRSNSQFIGIPQYDLEIVKLLKIFFQTSRKGKTLKRDFKRCIKEHSFQKWLSVCTMCTVLNLYENRIHQYMSYENIERIYSSFLTDRKFVLKIINEVIKDAVDFQYLILVDYLNCFISEIDTLKNVLEIENSFDVRKKMWNICKKIASQPKVNIKSIVSKFNQKNKTSLKKNLNNGNHPIVKFSKEIDRILTMKWSLYEFFRVPRDCYDLMNMKKLKKLSIPQWKSLARYMAKAIENKTTVNIKGVNRTDLKIINEYFLDNSRANNLRKLSSLSLAIMFTASNIACKLLKLSVVNITRYYDLVQFIKYGNVTDKINYTVLCCKVPSIRNVGERKSKYVKQDEGMHKVVIDPVVNGDVINITFSKNKHLECENHKTKDTDIDDCKVLDLILDDLTVYRENTFFYPRYQWKEFTHIINKLFGFKYVKGNFYYRGKIVNIPYPKRPNSKNVKVKVLSNDSIKIQMHDSKIACENYVYKKLLQSKITSTLRKYRGLKKMKNDGVLYKEWERWFYHSNNKIEEQSCKGTIIINNDSIVMVCMGCMKVKTIDYNPNLLCINCEKRKFAEVGKLSSKKYFDFNKQCVVLKNC